MRLVSFVSVIFFRINIGIVLVSNLCPAHIPTFCMDLRNLRTMKSSILSTVLKRRYHPPLFPHAFRVVYCGEFEVIRTVQLSQEAGFVASKTFGSRICEFTYISRTCLGINFSARRDLVVTSKVVVVAEIPSESGNMLMPNVPVLSSHP